MLAGIGENAGVADIGDGPGGHLSRWSHTTTRSWSFLPGAGHRGGGIVRDIMAMGARPAAGPASAWRRRRSPIPAACSTAWSAASARYGNPWACPTLWRDRLDLCHAGNPLVNALVSAYYGRRTLHLAPPRRRATRSSCLARTDGIGGCRRGVDT